MDEETTITEQEDQAAAAAAFEASFADKEPPPAPKPTTKAEPAEKTPDAPGTPAAAAAAQPEAGAAGAAPAAGPATPATEAAPTPAPSPKPDEAAELRAQVRRLEGRYGALHDEFQKLKTVKEAEGQTPAAAAKVVLERMSAEYPELGEALAEDLAKLGSLAGAKADPKAIDAMVTQRVQGEVARLRVAMVTDAHPTWEQDVYIEDVDPATGGKKRSPEYAAWRATLGEEQARAFELSDNPHHVIRRLGEFYAWKGKAAKDAEAKRTRLEANVQPQGVPRATPPTLSEKEAEMKGYLDGFNS